MAALGTSRSIGLIDPDIPANWDNRIGVHQWLKNSATPAASGLAALPAAMRRFRPFA